MGWAVLGSAIAALTMTVTRWGEDVDFVWGIVVGMASMWLLKDGLGLFR